MPPSISSLSIQGESSESPPIKWHELHCDPTLDTVLLSKDGVHFRASSHALKRESSLFDGMLSITPASHPSSFTPIALDFNAHPIALFLDLYATPSRSTDIIAYRALELGSLRDYEALIRYLDCDRFLAKVESAYLIARRSDPVAWLILASHDGDITSARLALIRCRELAVSITTDKVFYVAEQMRPAWQYPLVKCLLDDHMRFGPRPGATWPNEEELSAFEVQVGLLESGNLPQ